MIKDLGGDRIGSGNKMKIALRNYERSTHDLSYIWRSTADPGTLIPFMSLVALPGDVFDINLNADVKTHPTIGPLFGSFKLQLDVYTCPFRLYQSLLHNNKLGIGLNMEKVELPYYEVDAPEAYFTEDDEPDLAQVNPSSIIAYLGVRGFNKKRGIYRKNAVPLLAYYDIYKNYYANKQEGIGVIVHGLKENVIITRVSFEGSDLDLCFNNNKTVGYAVNSVITDPIVFYGNIKNADNIRFETRDRETITGNEFAESVVHYNNYVEITPKSKYNTTIIDTVYIDKSKSVGTCLTKFDLSNIDNVREQILKTTSGFKINNSSPLPYGAPFQYLFEEEHEAGTCMLTEMEGLAIKTYQSDIFNNWLSKEVIEGYNGIAEITAVNVADGSLKLDDLNLAKKVYDMLNRIAVSGGTYDDWVESVYTHEIVNRSETPVYQGGMSQEIVFQEVISTAPTNENPLGTLAGKGVLNQNKKGGTITIKVDEPSYIMGIVSITPRIDYSQGNEWDSNLLTMNDLHKPALDGIGFQDLITEQMAWWDNDFINNKEVKYSAGKQPAWINYMTNYNKTFGNFAKRNDQMFMTLNRRFEYDENGRIKDLTTYIDPEKFNYAFANIKLTAQNFWVQIASNITARRKMSAKIIPNL